MFKILGDENRWKILKLLAKKPVCVCKIEAKLGLHQNLVSHHLKVLKEAGFITIAEHQELDKWMYKNW